MQEQFEGRSGCGCKPGSHVRSHASRIRLGAAVSALLQASAEGLKCTSKFGMNLDDVIPNAQYRICHSRCRRRPTHRGLG
jgi:hypothetical protein